MREFGYAEVARIAATPSCSTASSIASDAEGRGVLDVWMSHGDRVDDAAARLQADGVSSADAPLAAMADEIAPLLRRAVPSRSHAHAAGQGAARALRARDLRLRAAGAIGNIIEDAIARVRAQVGKGKVLLGLSGGVDSSVVAALLHKAIGDQLTCVFVDHGLLRLNEGDAGHGDLRRQPRREGHPRRCRASASSTRCAARPIPEKKRKIIGGLFVEGVRRGSRTSSRTWTGSRRARSTRTSSSPRAARPARRTSSSRTTTSAACRRTCA